MRAITFDIRNYSSADGGAGEAGSADIPSPWGRTKRSRVASEGLAAVASGLTIAVAALCAEAAVAVTRPHFTYTAEIYASLGWVLLTIAKHTLLATVPYFAGRRAPVLRCNDRLINTPEISQYLATDKYPLNTKHL